MTSRDSGKTWSKPRAIAKTPDPSDHRLVSRQSNDCLSVLADIEGRLPAYRIGAAVMKIFHIATTRDWRGAAGANPVRRSLKDAVRPFDSESWQEVTGAHRGSPSSCTSSAFSCGNSWSS